MFEALLSLLCAISGTRPDALKDAPEGRARAATLGFLLALTATIASVNAMYALHRAFMGAELEVPLALFGGLAWGGVVFAIDRLLLLGMDKSRSRWHLAGQLALRLPLAFVISQVLSKPLLLAVCEPVIERALQVETRDLSAAERAANAEAADLAGHKGSVASLQAAVEAQRTRANGEPDSQEYLDSRRAAEKADGELSSVHGKNSVRIPKARADLARLSEKSPLDSQERIAELTSLIHDWNVEESRASRAAKAAAETRNRVAENWRAEERERLTQVEAELGTARKALVDVTVVVDKENEVDVAAVESTMRPNLVNQFRVLRRVENDPDNVDGPPIRQFELSFDVLFFLLEIIPILMKAVGRTTPLDDAITAKELIDREQINLDALQLMTDWQAVAQVERATRDAWRQKRLEVLAEERKTLTAAELEQQTAELGARRAALATELAARRAEFARREARPVPSPLPQRQT